VTVKVRNSEKEAMRIGEARRGEENIYRMQSLFAVLGNVMTSVPIKNCKEIFSISQILI
jgi:hypothetical protein